MKYLRASTVMAACAALAACATGRMASPDADDDGDDTDDTSDDAPRIDAPSTPGADAAEPDAEPHIDAAPHPDAPSATATNLLLTEIVLTPTEAEMIEIANPTDQTVSLAGYYLADTGEYFRLPASVTVGSSDFIVKFPAGATIGPHAVITVALGTIGNFQTSYMGTSPTYSVASGTMTLVAGSNGTLTNAGEPVVLFYWDGATDLVRDVDIVLAGIPAANNALTDKSGVAIDGPDADSTTTAYGSDARTILAQTGAPGSAQSTKRIALETGHEQQLGSGNGMDGDDETSEDTRSTWDSTFSAATPGAVPAVLLP